MSVRSSLSAPSPQSGSVGTTITGAVVANTPSTTPIQQNFSPVTLSAGTWAVTTSIQILDVAVAAGQQYIGLSIGAGAPLSILNFYADSIFTATVADRVFSFTNIITLTDSSTLVSLYTDTTSTAASQQYQSWGTQPSLKAVKLA